MKTPRVVVVGAGIAGLSAAVDLARHGCEVLVVERGAAPGGKMRAVAVSGQNIDAGPTVLTMLGVFDALFADAGATLGDHVTLRPLTILARHAWSDAERLDLHADVDASADAIGAFAGAAEAQGFRAFCERSRQIFQTLEHVFIHAQRPDPVSLALAAAPQGLSNLWRISPFATMWQSLGQYFKDPRLRQLFARYATYCGSSPFLSPATLMLVAHAEQSGVWTVDGGMHKLADALATLAASKGAAFRYGCDVAEIIVSNGEARGVVLASGEHIPADAVLCNADTSAIADGLFGKKAEHAAPRTLPNERSLSAVTWLAVAKTSGFPLHRHNVFFSNDYRAEFDDILSRKRLPETPTVYICAQDRDDDSAKIQTPERLLCLVNAPAIGDCHSFDPSEIEPCRDRTFRHLQQCGLTIEWTQQSLTTVTPADFNRLYPATGGALYGRASHGWKASFQRPGSRSRLPRLYLAGGSAHPGPGVPMAAISGRLAAQSILADLASTARSRTTAMRGGTSTQ